MANAIYCQDGWADVMIASHREDIQEHPILGSATGPVEHYQRRAQLCRDLGLVPRTLEEYAAVHTDIPALIIEGDMDPITPPPLAKAILPGFTRATYVEFPFAGHGPSRSVKCAGSMLNKFYDAPQAKPDLSCVENMKAPDFYTLFTTSAAPRLLVMGVEDRKALIVPGVWGGLSLLTTLVAFIFLTISPIGRWIDRRPAPPTSGARSAAWIATLLSVVAVGVLGAAIGVTYDASQALLLFGLVSWARFGAMAGLLAGLAGLSALLLVVRARRTHGIPFSSLVGLLITSTAAVSLSAFLGVWDLGPF